MGIYILAITFCRCTSQVACWLW